MDKRRSAIIRLGKKAIYGLIALVLLLLIIPLPKSDLPHSTVMYASDGALLGAKIASDGQWRFPISDSLPSNYIRAVLLFEDEYFYMHPGFNPISIWRAIRQNMRAGKVVSGGSTITMQLARILRGNRNRTVIQKLLEFWVTLQLELRFSKSEILNQYASLAPFGGNVVGLEAAAWRYYGRSSSLLSLSEYATLAVLPNAPGLIYPGKRQEQLALKRNALLLKMFEKGAIDEMEYELAIDEPLPQKPYALPMKAPHLMDFVIQSGHEGQNISSTINDNLQSRHRGIASRFHDKYHDNEIHNMAILVADVETGSILSYVGNSDCKDDDEGVDVDIIRAPRSSGSILKPLLYAAAFDEGLIAQTSLIPDVPTRIAGYAPKNFDGTYGGAVRSEDALTKSLNIPAVKLLQDFGVPKFHELLNDLGFSTIKSSSDHYGLSLILGGAEVSLFDLVNVYRKSSKHVQSYVEHGSQYDSNLSDIGFIPNGNRATNWEEAGDINAGALWQMMDVLSNVKRPREEDGWEHFNGSHKIAWKTGTSFGHRDAWAVGMDGTHVVGVWVGNADGEGRPGLTGLNYAGPILFEVFNSLGAGEWIPSPLDDLMDMAVCTHSGFRLGPNCTDTTDIVTNLNSVKLKTCDLHKVLNVDTQGSFQVNLDCHPANEMVRRSYFQLSSSQAYYYKKHNANYPSIPPWKRGCKGESAASIEIVYPFASSSIAIAKGLGGEENKLVMSAAHTHSESRIHWYLNEIYLGSTSSNHSLSVIPEVGEHFLYVVDDNGVEASQRFSVVD